MLFRPIRNQQANCKKCQCELKVIKLQVFRGKPWEMGTDWPLRISGPDSALWRNVRIHSIDDFSWRKIRFGHCWDNKQETERVEVKMSIWNRNKVSSSDWHRLEKPLWNSGNYGESSQLIHYDLPQNYYFPLKISKSLYLSFLLLKAQSYLHL